MQGPLAEPVGILAERTAEDGARKIIISAKERKALKKQKLAEQAALLFLDIEKRHTYPQIAEAMGISVHQLREVVRTDEFQVAYNDLFPEVGHDPRYKAARAALADMVPTAVSVAREILENPRAPVATRWKIAEKLLESAEALRPIQQSERKDLVDFLLKNKGDLNVNMYQVTVPPEYLAAVGEEDIIDAEP